MAELTSWAVDLADVAAVYPMQGMEVILTIVGVAFWLGWHVWQINSEGKILSDEEARVKDHPELTHWVRKQD